MTHVRIMLMPNLPEHLRPCQVVRRRGVTMIGQWPWATPVEAVAWSIDNLTVLERNAIREALGEPPLPARVPDSFMDAPYAVAPESLLVDPSSLNTTCANHDVAFPQAM